MFQQGGGGEGGRELQLRRHLGCGWYVTVKSNFACVNIRKYWIPNGEKEEVPSRFGIALRLPEWSQLVLGVDTVNDMAPEIAGAVPCDFQESHMGNQMCFFACKECNPFEEIDF